MNIVVFGLTVTSSWGNGHATLWRGLIRALGARNHRVAFFERNVPYYAAHRDLVALDGHAIYLYDDWDSASGVREEELRRADVAIVTSYCPDADAATAFVLGSPVHVRAYYDMDTPITLDALRRGRPVNYLPSAGLSGFDIVMSFAGGPALDEMRECLDAKRVEPLYGSVDTHAYRRTAADGPYQSDVTYLGTYADDRQAALDALFLEPARRRPALRFLLGGSLYPANFPWTPNLYYIRHVPPQEHSKFYSSCRLTVNVTRGPMAEMGFCPSGRLFEAAACGTPVMSDAWPGIEEFFEPGREILVVHSAEDAVEVVDLPSEELAEVGRRAQERVLACHSADRRAEQLETILQSV